MTVTIPNLEHQEALDITLDDAWVMAKTLIADKGGETNESRVFRKLIGEWDIYKFEPRDLAVTIRRCVYLALHAPKYFATDGRLADAEINYYCLLVMRGEIK